MEALPLDWRVFSALTSRCGKESLGYKNAPEVGRVYFLAPLFVLSGLDLFNQPDIEIQYFPTRAEAVAWGDADIEHRRGVQ
jgi:hypothetical protein